MEKICAIASIFLISLGIHKWHLPRLKSTLGLAVIGQYRGSSSSVCQKITHSVTTKGQEPLGLSVSGFHPFFLPALMQYQALGRISLVRYLVIKGFLHNVKSSAVFSLSVRLRLCASTKILTKIKSLSPLRSDAALAAITESPVVENWS
jgi:hypothetical protein